MSKYHVIINTKGVNYWKGTVDELMLDVFDNDHKILTAIQNINMPKDFNSIGSQLDGLDIDQLLLAAQNDKFQYIDKYGKFNTVEVYDHTPEYLNDFLHFDENPSLPALVKKYAWEIALTNHAEFDLYV